MRIHANFTRLTYGRSRVNVKVEPRLTSLNFKCVRTEKIRDNGNQLKKNATVKTAIVVLKTLTIVMNRNTNYGELVMF